MKTYSELGMIDAVISCFSQIQSRNSILAEDYATVISTFAQNRNFQGVDEAWAAMQIAGKTPEARTLESLVYACVEFTPFSTNSCC